MASTLFKLLEDLTDELPGCRLTSVVNQETGLSLASVASGDPLDTAGADAFHSDLYRVTNQVLTKLDFSQSPQGFVLTGKEMTFVSLPLEDTGYFWHVATDRRTTVGFTQAIMRKHASRIQESVRSLFE